MKRCLVTVGLFAVLLLGCGNKDEDDEQNLYSKAADKAVEAIRAIVPDDMEIVEERRGLVNPVYYSKGEGIAIMVQRRGVSLEVTKGPDIAIHLMKAPYNGELVVHELGSSTPPRYLGANRTWQVYIHGGTQEFCDKLVKELKLTKPPEEES